MGIRFCALAALSALACAHSAFAAKAPLAVYYSFDAPVPAPLFTAIQSEMSRILAPSGMSADWISGDTSRSQKLDYPGLVVLRFHGHCGAEGSPYSTDIDPSGKALAESEIIDGHVLPFAKVDCDRVRALISPAMGGMPPVWKTGILGRALARVSAHEIYHMLAGVQTHDERGIFQAEHSLRDLTDATFSFAAPENNWLHSWLERQMPPQQAAQVSPVPTLPPLDGTVYDASGSAAGR